MRVSVDVIDGVTTLGPPACDICGFPVTGEMVKAIGREGHSVCIDKWASRFAPCSWGPAEWASQCPTIAPGGTRGHVVRKAIV